MDTHAALTSDFPHTWTGDPGTPVYDALAHERGISPAGLLNTRPRGFFEPARQVLLPSVEAEREGVDLPVATVPAPLDGGHPADDPIALAQNCRPPRTHPYLDYLDAAREVVAHPGEVVELPTAEYPRPALPLAVR